MIFLGLQIRSSASFVLCAVSAVVAPHWSAVPPVSYFTAAPGNNKSAGCTNVHFHRRYIRVIHTVSLETSLDVWFQNIRHS